MYGAAQRLDGILSEFAHVADDKSEHVDQTCTVYSFDLY